MDLLLPLSDRNHECVGECGTVAFPSSIFSPSPLSPSCFHLAAELSRTLMKVGGRGSKGRRKGGSIYSFSSRQPTNMLCGRAHSLTQGLPSFIRSFITAQELTRAPEHLCKRAGAVGMTAVGLKAPTIYRMRRGTDAVIFTASVMV